MDQPVVKHGRRYATPINIPRQESERQLTDMVSDSIARPYSMQSMAVVLLDPHAFQLPRNDLDSHCAEFLALAVVNGCRRRR